MYFVESGPCAETREPDPSNNSYHETLRTIKFQFFVDTSRFMEGGRVQTAPAFPLMACECMIWLASHIAVLRLLRLMSHILRISTILF